MFTEIRRSEDLWCYIVVLISFEGVHILVKCIRFYTYNNVSNCVNTVNE